MRIVTMVGMILIALGMITLIYGGITYTSSRNEITMGDMHVKIDETSHFPITPIAGALCVVAGITLMVVDRRRQSRTRAE